MRSIELRGQELTAGEGWTLWEDPHVVSKAKEAGRLACERVGHHKKGRLGNCSCSAFSGLVTPSA